MTSSEHTPGPYTWYETDEGLCRVFPVAGGLIVAECSVRNPFCAEQRANARLFAAAPDLLAALQAIADHDFNNCDGITPADCMENMRETARAAIAKAKGTDQ